MKLSRWISLCILWGFFSFIWSFLFVLLAWGFVCDGVSLCGFLFVFVWLLLFVCLGIFLQAISTPCLTGRLIQRHEDMPACCLEATQPTQKGSPSILAVIMVLFARALRCCGQ